MSSLLQSAIEDEVELERILKPAGITSLTALFTEMKAALSPAAAASGTSSHSLTGQEILEWMRKRMASASESDLLSIGGRLVRDGFAIQLSSGQLRFTVDATYRLTDRVKFRRSVSSPMLVANANAGEARKGSELQDCASPSAGKPPHHVPGTAAAAAAAAEVSTWAKAPAAAAGATVHFACKVSNSDLEHQQQSSRAKAETLFATTRAPRTAALPPMPNFVAPPPLAVTPSPASSASITSPGRKLPAMPAPPPLVMPGKAAPLLRSEGSGDVSSGTTKNRAFAVATISGSSAVSNTTPTAVMNMRPAGRAATATTAPVAASTSHSALPPALQTASTVSASIAAATSAPVPSGQSPRSPRSPRISPSPLAVPSPRGVASTLSGPISASSPPAQTSAAATATPTPPALSPPPSRPLPVTVRNSTTTAPTPIAIPTTSAEQQHAGEELSSPHSPKKVRKEKREKREKSSKKEKREKKSRERSERTLRGVAAKAQAPEPDQPHRSRAPLAPLESLPKIDLSSSPTRSGGASPSASLTSVTGSSPFSKQGFGSRVFLRARPPASAAPLTTMGKRGMEQELAQLRELNLELVATLERGLALFPLPVANDASRATQYEHRLVEWLLTQLLAQQQRLQAALDGNQPLAEQLQVAATGVPLYLLYLAWLPVLESVTGRLLWSSQAQQQQQSRTGGPAALMKNALHILPTHLPRLTQILQRLSASQPQASAAAATFSRLQRELDLRGSLSSAAQRVWDLNQRLEPGQPLPPGFPSLSECLNVETRRTSVSGDDISSSLHHHHHHHTAREPPEVLRLESIASRASGDAEEHGHVLLLFPEVICFATLHLGTPEAEARPVTLQPKTCLSLVNLEVRDLPDAGKSARYLLELSVPLSKVALTFSFATEEVKSLWLDQLPPYRRVLRFPVEL